MMKLKLQYFGHLMQRANSLEKTVMLGTVEGKRRKGRQRMRWLDSNTDSTDRNLSELLEIVKDRGVLWCIPWYCKESGMLSNWPATTKRSVNIFGLFNFTAVDRNIQKPFRWTELRVEHTQWTWYMISRPSPHKRTFSIKSGAAPLPSLLLPSTQLLRTTGTRGIRQRWWCHLTVRSQLAAGKEAWILAPWLTIQHMPNPSLGGFWGLGECFSM